MGDGGFDYVGFGIGVKGEFEWVVSIEGIEMGRLFGIIWDDFGCGVGWER